MMTLTPYFTLLKNRFKSISSCSLEEVQQQKKGEFLTAITGNKEMLFRGVFYLLMPMKVLECHYRWQNFMSP